MKIGASNAHCAEPLNMNKFSIAVNKTNPIITVIPVKPTDCKKFAPDTAIHEPILDHSK